MSIRKCEKVGTCKNRRWIDINCYIGTSIYKINFGHGQNAELCMYILLCIYMSIMYV